MPDTFSPTATSDGYSYCGTFGFIGAPPSQRKK
jgi:hypothetical protein